MNDRPKGGDLEASLFSRAYKDADFHQRLLQDPKAALEEFLEVELPGDLEITLVQDTPTSNTLVMPHIPPEVADGLSEEDLAGEILGTCSKQAYGVVLGTCSNSGTLWVNKA